MWVSSLGLMARTKDNRFGLCLALAPASIIIGDSVSAQFFQALIELLSTHSANVSIKAMTKGGSYWSSTGPVSQKLCAGPGCEILRSLPPHATAAHICNGAVWLAFIRNDYLDVSASYPVKESKTLWHCGRDIDEFSPQVRKALRKSTHLCGPPSLLTTMCDGSRCAQSRAASYKDSAITLSACKATCAMALNGVSCGSQTDPCEGCNNEMMVSSLCESALRNRARFCASTEDGPTQSLGQAFPQGQHFCMPWANVSTLRHFRVVLLNSGAHRLPTEAYRTKMRAVGHVVRGYLEQNPLGRAVFRTTVPGFSGCSATRSAPPHPSVAVAEAYLKAHPFYDQHEFVPIANRIAGDEIVSAGGSVLDVYGSSILRLDDRVGEMNTAGREDCLHYRDPLLKSSLASWAEALGRMLLNRDQNTWFDAAVGAGAVAHLPAAPQPPTPSVKVRAEAKVLASTTDPVIAAAIRAKEARAKAKTKAMAVAIPMARAAAPGHQGGGGS